MRFFDRTLLAVLLPALAWGFLGAIKIYYMHHNYGGTLRPTSDEVLFSQVLLIEGGLLCLVALVPAFRAWRARRLNGVLIGSAIVAGLFLFLWFPSAVEGLARRLGVLA